MRYGLISEDVRLICARSLEVTYKAQSLSEQPLMSRVLAMRLALYVDLLPTSPSAMGKYEALRRVIMSLRHIDSELYASSWSKCKEHLLQVLPQGEGWYSAFKQLRASQIPYKWIWSSVMGLAEEGASIEQLIQWIVFDEKLNLRSLDLSTEAVDSYVEQERAMEAWSYDLPQLLYEVADEWFADFCLQDHVFVPKHGNGATAELSRRQATLPEKERLLTLTPELEQWCRIRDISNIDAEWFFWNKSESHPSLRTARLQLVPKSMVKNRTISAEPTTLQYVQQDLFRVFDSFFRSRLSDHVDLHDQAKSRDLCLVASQSGALATLDLSSASDSVSTRLVVEVLQGTPADDLLTGLLTSRSTHVKLPNGQVVQLHKYGGMGNGTTFPVETLIFALLCEVAARQVAGRRHGYVYRVYGDDIIADRRMVEALVTLLENCHFTVNISKSFWSTTGHIFREACGMWALDGRDITPLRLSRRLYWSNGASPAEALGWVALMNESLRHGFLSLRASINSILSPQSWYPQLYRVAFSDEAKPWVPKPAPYVLTFDTNATQWRVRHRYCRSLQRREVRCYVAQQRRTKGESADEVFFRQWQRETLTTSPDPPDWTEGRDWEHSGPTPLKWGETWVTIG